MQVSPREAYKRRGGEGGRELQDHELVAVAIPSSVVYISPLTRYPFLLFLRASRFRTPHDALLTLPVFSPIPSQSIYRSELAASAPSFTYPHQRMSPCISGVPMHCSERFPCYLHYPHLVPFLCNRWASLRWSYFHCCRLGCRAAVCGTPGLLAGLWGFSDRLTYPECNNMLK